MKITIERIGAETQVIETDNAVLVSSTDIDGKNGTGRHILINSGSDTQITGIIEQLIRTAAALIEKVPVALLYLSMSKRE
ncbi:MAG: hypothetical protein RRZ71_03095 [Clostridia bacterium]